MLDAHKAIILADKQEEGRYSNITGMTNLSLKDE